MFLHDKNFSRKNLVAIFQVKIQPNIVENVTFPLL